MSFLSALQDGIYEKSSVMKVLPLLDNFILKILWTFSKNANAYRKPSKRQESQNTPIFYWKKYYNLHKIFFKSEQIDFSIQKGFALSLHAELELFGNFFNHIHQNKKLTHFLSETTKI